jgi:serine/threonine protein kinase
VALKLLRADLARDREVRARFEGEARAAARLRHPHVVSIFDIGEESGVPFIVMELLPGGTLADRIHTGPLAESSVLPLASQVLGALAAAHSAGILHRDIKPANILFDDRGEAKVADFEIARSMESGVVATFPGTSDMLTTPSYVAPERAEGQPASPSSDLWSLGVVLYEALTRRPPFPGDNPLAAALAAREGLMTPLSSLRPDLSPELVAVVERAVAPNPADRFVSAAAMAAALGVGLAGSSPSRPIHEEGNDPAREADPLPTATRVAPPELAAAALSAHLLAAELGRRGKRPADHRRPAHRRRRRPRFHGWEWPAVGAAAAVLAAAIAVGASGVLGGSAGSGTAGRDSPSPRHTGYVRPVTSTPPSSSTTSTSPATVPPTTAPPTTAAPSTTLPPTTAVPPPSTTTTPTAPPTTAPLPPSTVPPTTAAPPTAPPPTQPSTTTAPAPTTTAPAPTTTAPAPATTAPAPSTTAPPATAAHPDNPSTTAAASAAAVQSNGNPDNPGHAGSKG